MVSLRLIVVSVVVGLVGCAAKAPDIYDKDAAVQPVVVPISSDLEQLRVSFIARIMSRPHVRNKIQQEVAAASDRLSLAEAGVAVGAAGAIATDMAVGAVGSSAGAGFGGAAILGGLVFDVLGDNTMKNAGQMWLPGSLNGVDIRSPEEAMAAAAKNIDSRLTDIADRNGWKLSCVHGCGGFNQIFEIKTMGRLSEQYQYRPETVMVHTQILDFEAVVDRDIDRKVIGDDIRWKTKFGNTAIVGFFADEVRGADGKVELVTLVEDGEKSVLHPRCKKALINVRLGRDLNRSFFADKYLFSGTNQTSEGMIFYNRKIYRAGGPSDERLAEGIVNEESLLK